VFPDENVIKRLVAEVCALEASAICGDRPLIEYGLDSARAIDLLIGLESEFDIRIPDEAARKMRTVDDIVAYVRAKATATGST